MFQRVKLNPLATPAADTQLMGSTRVEVLGICAQHRAPTKAPLKGSDSAGRREVEGCTVAQEAGDTPFGNLGPGTRLPDLQREAIPLGQRPWFCSFSLAAGGPLVSVRAGVPSRWLQELYPPALATASKTAFQVPSRFPSQLRF